MAMESVVLGLVAGLVTGLGCAGWRRVLTAPRWVEAPRPDRHHQTATSKAGGPAWLTGFWVVLVSVLALAWVDGDPVRTRSGQPDPLLGILGVASLLAYVLGDLDDRGRLGPRLKGPLQFGLIVLAWIAFVSARGGWADLAQTPESALWALAAAGVLQLSLGIFDNMDGVLAAVSIPGLLFLGSGVSGSAAAWIAAGASVGFLVWNVPPARVFLGNRGSSTLATVIAILLACRWTEEAGQGGARWPALMLAPFAWPLTDLVFVTVRRLREGRRPWHGGRDHTTHALARATGGDRLVWIGAMVIASLGALAALLLDA